LNGDTTNCKAYAILAVTPNGKRRKRKFSDFWLCILLEDLNNNSNVKVQWMQRLRKGVTYEIIEVQDIIPTESIICTGIEMKFLWNNNDSQNPLGSWKMLTSASIITKLHQDVQLERNKFVALPLQRQVCKVLDFNVLPA
jgi:hypothetical protein